MYENVAWEHTGPPPAAARGSLRGSCQCGQHDCLQPMNTEHSTNTRTPRGSHYYHITYKSPEPWIETRHTALVFLMRFFNKFNRLSISALELHAILLYVIGCIQHAAHAEDDDRPDIVIRGLVEISLPACFQHCARSSQQCTHQFSKFTVGGNWERRLSTTWSSRFMWLWHNISLNTADIENGVFHFFCSLFGKIEYCENRNSFQCLFKATTRIFHILLILKAPVDKCSSVFKKNVLLLLYNWLRYL